MTYPNVQLFIDGKWRPAASGKTIPVLNPATEERVGTVAHAERADLDRALEAADKGFRTWRKVSAFDRSKVMRTAADLLRERADKIAPLLTMEQGKPLPEAKGEALAGADVIDWFAEEGTPRPMAALFRRGRRASISLWSRSRSVRWPRSHRGTSRSTRWCASCPRRWRRAARSSSRHLRKRQPRPPN